MPGEDDKLRRRLRGFARRHPRLGWRKAHAVIRREGPEFWLEDVSTHGTYRWNGADWTRLPIGKSVLLEAADRLFLGGVTLEVESGD